jgi:isocitrate lyase
MFRLAHAYARDGMPAYVQLQDEEFAMERDGYTATRHQAEVGTGYFDRVVQVVSGEQASTLALIGSTERAQFDARANGANAAEADEAEEGDDEEATA